MAELINKLNYQFNTWVLKAEKDFQTASTSLEDRALITRWLKKLSDSGRNYQEAQVRNDFMFCLLQNIRNKQLAAPFDKDPPAGPLLSNYNLLPDKETYEEQKTFYPYAEPSFTSLKRAEIFEKSPDKGAFLAKQPIPKNGTFCYLAVTSRPSNL